MILRIVFFLLAALGALQATRAAPIADVPVVTQSGDTRHFYSDLIRGRVVAINFIYTGCGAICPLLGARFAQAQRQLGADAGDVALISISIDPVTDTPQRLAAWSARFGAAPGWTLVTGAKPDIDALVKSLGATTADRDAHAPLIVVIDDRHGGVWQRLDGLIEPAALLEVLRADAARTAAR